MTERFRKIRIQNTPGLMAMEFVPRKTQRGHYVWTPYAALTGALTEDQMAATDFAGCARGSVYNKRLNDQDVIRFLGSGEVPLEHVPADAIDVIFQCFAMPREGVSVSRLIDRTEFVVQMGAEKFLIKASRIRE